MNGGREPRDHVTGLATRGDFERALETTLASRPPQDAALAICDVVGLKAVNEADGFVAGDIVLAAAAAERTVLAAAHANPPLRAAATAAKPEESAPRLVDRLYATMRAS